MALYHVHLLKTGRQNEHYWNIFQAKSFKKAIEKVLNLCFTNYDGDGSFYLDKDKPITRLPSCKLLFVGKKEGKAFCGPPKLSISLDHIEYEEGTYGRCILGTKIYDSEKDCCFYKFPFHPHSCNFPGKEWKEKEIIINDCTYKIVDLSKISPKGSFFILSCG